MLDGRVDAGAVSRQAGAVGTSAVGLLDNKTTPIEPAMPGVEVHAQVLESMLGKTMLTSPSYAIARRDALAVRSASPIIALAPLLSAGALFWSSAAPMAALLVGVSWYFFTAAQSPDRLHLPADREPR